MSTQDKTDRISFGLFEVDLPAGELWKAGYKVRLAGQPFRVLTVLLARPGEVVTREELQEKVWGTNTNVDFERAVAGAINKVREALGDSAENPRFIQTLPKRGYRFIAPVALVHLAPASTTAPQTTAAELPRMYEVPVARSTQEQTVQRASTSDAASPSAGVETDSSPPYPSQRSGHAAKWLLAVLSVLVLFFASLAAWLWKMRSTPGPLRVDELTHSGAISTGPLNLENLLTLATDGNRVFTSVLADGRPRLSTISISTGEVAPLPLPTELTSSLLADLSRDGSKMLLKSHQSSASEQALWIVPSSGGSALRVGSVLAHDAAWMPDGASILYASGDDLSVIRLDNGVSTHFAHLKGRAFWMRWSPDGIALRFTLQDPVGHTSSIWEMKGPGAQPRQLDVPQGAQGSTCCGTWTADGMSYVFISGDNLWELKGSGLNAKSVQLTNGPLRFFSPVADRTGHRIFFIGLDHPFGLQQFSSTEGFHPAPSFLANATRVDFSRDGLWVAWTDNDAKLWRARAGDGSDEVQLTPDYLQVFMAHWSPDGKRLAVMARRPGEVWRTYLVDADGGTPQPLLQEDRNAADPGWSADGRKLVFGREADMMGKESGSHAIQIIDLATMKTETLPGSEGMFSPRWSPDGRWIAALTLNQETLMLYNVAQQRWTELARTSAADPVWSEDSKSLYAHAFLEDKQPILRIGVPAGDVHVVADLSSFHDRATVNYFFGGLTPNREPLVQPRIGTGDLYTLDLKVR